MKIKMYMYDRDLELTEEAAEEFVEQYEDAKGTMKDLLSTFEDEDTRTAMFYMMSLRALIDDFIEFCTDDIPADLMERLLNNEDVYEDELEDYDDDDDFEITVEFDD